MAPGADDGAARRERLAAARLYLVCPAGPGAGETPTKPGRPAVGLDIVRYAAAHARRPFFAIGGLDATNLADVLDAGARRVVVLRAIAAAPDPEGAARELRSQLDARPLQR